MSFRKKVVVDTDQKKGQCFKVEQSGTKFYVYRQTGDWWGSYTKIGETKSFEDAITIIKANAKGSVTHTKIEDL